MKTISKKSFLAIILLIFPLSFILQIFIVPKLPEKYFYDSMGILGIVNGTINTRYFDSSYMFTGNFFRYINFLNLATFLEWAILLTLITVPFIQKELIRYKKATLDKIVFILITVLFLNIYIFRISKDFVQFLIWTLIYFILNSNFKLKKQIFFTFIIFIFEAVFFRSYYAITGILFILIYKYLSGSKNKTKLGKILIVLGVGITMVLFVLQKISPNGYDQIVNMRYYQNRFRENTGDANTAINDMLSGSVPYLYCVNYFINLIRISFPIELIIKGLKYFPFVIYQCYFSYEIIKKILENDKDNSKWLAVIGAYILVSILFEPDFGSVIRHEVSLVFIIFKLILGGEENEKTIKRS